jgi:CHASE2 domain-containing sensor protein
MLKHLLGRRTLLATLTVFAIFGLVYFTPFNLEIFDPIQKALSDFEFSDVVFSQYRRGEKVDTNVVIVNIGNNNRVQIAEQIRAINAFSPKVIALDAVFPRERTPELDTPLVNALREAKNVVLALEVKKRDDDNELKFDSLRSSHPKFIGANVTFGHISFPKASEDALAMDGTVRTIAPKVYFRDSLTIAAFPVSIVDRANPALAQKFLKRGNDLETINYRGDQSKFIVLDVDQVTPDNLEIVRGKIVLMGFLGESFAAANNRTNTTDKFWTPVSLELGKSPPDMYGVVIHANIVSMVLAGDYINEMSDLTALALAVLLCYVNIALFYWIEDNLPTFYGAVVKFIQYGQAMLLMLSSISILNYFNYNIQIGLMLAVALLAPDLYELYDSTVRFLKPKFRAPPQLLLSDEEIEQIKAGTYSSI